MHMYLLMYLYKYWLGGESEHSGREGSEENVLCLKHLHVLWVRERTHKPLDNDNDRKQLFICWGFIMKFTNTANEPTQDPLMQMGR